MECFFLPDYVPYAVKLDLKTGMVAAKSNIFKTMCRTTSSNWFMFSSGVGFGMIIVPFLVGTYYNVIMAWCILYLFESFRKDVPWKHCGNEWNTPLCA